MQPKKKKKQTARSPLTLVHLSIEAQKTALCLDQLLPPGQKMKVKEKVTQSCLTLCDHTHLYCPWDFPGQNPGLGSLSLLQGNLPTPGIEPRSPTFQVDSFQLGHQGSPRILEWVAYPFSMGSSRPKDQNPPVIPHSLSLSTHPLLRHIVPGPHDPSQISVIFVALIYVATEKGISLAPLTTVSKNSCEDRPLLKA